MYDESFRARYNLAPVAISTNDTFGTTPNHIHREIEMLYIVSGSSKIFIADKVFTAHGGDLFFVNPMEVHSIVVNKKGGAYKHHCICFDTSIIADKIVLKENIATGQQIESFDVFADDGNGYKKLCSSTIIGAKRVCRFEKQPINKIKIVITSYRVKATINKVELYCKK